MRNPETKAPPESTGGGRILRNFLAVEGAIAVVFVASLLKGDNKVNLVRTNPKTSNQVTVKDTGDTRKTKDTGDKVIPAHERKWGRG